MANKETLEFVRFIADVANGIERTLADGKFTLEDLANFFNIAVSAPTAIQGSNLIIEEIKSWNEEEKAQVIVLFEDALNFAADDVEAAIEDIFAAVILLVSGITKLGLTKAEGDKPADEVVTD